MNMSKASLDTSQTSKNFAKIVKSSEAYSEPSGTSKRELQLLSHKNGNKQVLFVPGNSCCKIQGNKVGIDPRRSLCGIVHFEVSSWDQHFSSKWSHLSRFWMTNYQLGNL